MTDIAAVREDTQDKLRRLESENQQLRLQLEAQYQLMIQVTDTVAKGHLSRIQAAATALVDINIANELQRDFDETRHKLDVQLPGVTTVDRDPAKLAEQLRSLEHSARKWAKKFLHKVKCAAAAAERRAGLQLQPTNSTSARGATATSSIASLTTADTQQAYSRLPTRAAMPASPEQQAQRLDIMDSIVSEEPRHMEELRATAESMQGGVSALPRYDSGAPNGRNGALIAREAAAADQDVFGTLDTRTSDVEMRTFGDLGASGGLSGKHRRSKTIFNRLFAHKPR